MALLRGFLLLIGFLLLGETVMYVTQWPIPGAVLGMILLTAWLMLRGHINADLATASQALITFLTMLIMPGVVGVFFMGDQLDGQWLAIVGSLTLGTLLSVLTTMLLMICFMPGKNRDERHD